VVGGGIAGATATIALEQSGISVLWIRPEWQCDSHKAGESLAPAANPILSSLGLSFILENNHHRHANATFSAWGQEALVERNSAVHLEGPGNIIDRVKFEEDLFRIANESSAIVIEDELQSIAEEEGLWQLTSKSGTVATARFIIDASGRSQVVGRHCKKAGGERALSETDDHLVAAYAFIRQKENTNVIATPATIIESVENGWWYASLLPSGYLTVNFYSDPDIMPKRITTDLSCWLQLIQHTHQIAHWIEDAEFIVDSPPKLASAATRWLTPAAGINQEAGWAAIGDAAVAFDPLSAHGMTTALWAAVRAPDFVKAYLAGDNQPLKNYSDSVEEGRQHYIEQRSNMYSQEKRFQDYEFWARRKR